MALSHEHAERPLRLTGGRVHWLRKGVGGARRSLPAVDPAMQYALPHISQATSNEAIDLPQGTNVYIDVDMV